MGGPARQVGVGAGQVGGRVPPNVGKWAVKSGRVQVWLAQRRLRALLHRLVVHVNGVVREWLVSWLGFRIRGLLEWGQTRWVGNFSVVWNELVGGVGLQIRRIFRVWAGQMCGVAARRFAGPSRSTIGECWGLVRPVGIN